MLSDYRYSSMKMHKKVPNFHNQTSIKSQKVGIFKKLNKITFETEIARLFDE